MFAVKQQDLWLDLSLHLCLSVGGKKVFNPKCTNTQDLFPKVEVLNVKNGYSWNTVKSSDALFSLSVGSLIVSAILGISMLSEEGSHPSLQAISLKPLNQQKYSANK